MMNQASTSKMKRLANFIIDSFVIAVVVLILNQAISFLARVDYLEVLAVSVFLAYYFLWEFLTGRTIGKIFTKTRVYSLKSHNKWFWILIRTILRLNPLDLYSFLVGWEKGTHDVLSFTRVVDTKT